MKKQQQWIVIMFGISLISFLGYWGMEKISSGSTQTLKVAQPMLAIVIDDFGGADTHGVAQFMELKQPITVAVMPNLVNSKEHSEEAHKRGHEVILHQPMEPLHGKDSWLGPGAIKSDMSYEEIKKVFLDNLATVPHAEGFNNHTGSKITSNKDKVAPMLEVAKDKGLFVLDSRTSDKSQVIKVAKSMQVPWVKRDVFLDEVKSKAVITRNLKKACAIAKKQGYAISIGHVGPGGNVTAEAVKEALPLIEKEGVKLVPLSQVVKLKSNREKV
ncbi:protein of unknown function DUF610, YibQ [Desulforamulus reducens MI-1]|uniref:Divergent polysaccharide deacetylase family protein n=1 Tax=Desulforamulus reducens (strain ATCC BAA-1160 / DSM 100696 / MI-1) TaxID=349161 RepID=A4J4V2_DESRM|nr:divergent polysaccharide deacetylase family protein [Desulforamulus reducens]ABO50105.1 protein of unknown function DUF610, YibQ [Desulforamulus reducens MI-1]